MKRMKSLDLDPNMRKLRLLEPRRKLRSGEARVVRKDDESGEEERARARNYNR